MGSASALPFLLGVVPLKAEKIVFAICCAIIIVVTTIGIFVYGFDLGMRTASDQPISFEDWYAYLDYKHNVCVVAANGQEWVYTMPIDEYEMYLDMWGASGYVYNSSCLGQ